jgi:rRNA maturation endonuclease Nob1
MQSEQYECRGCHISKPLQKQQRCPVCGTPMTKAKEASK